MALLRVSYRAFRGAAGLGVHPGARGGLRAALGGLRGAVGGPRAAERALRGVAEALDDEAGGDERVGEAEGAALRLWHEPREAPGFGRERVEKG